MNESLLVYKIRLVTSTSFELILIRIAKRLLKFLELNPVFISKESVLITYLGSRLVLEPRVPPSGKPQGIILPRLPFIRTSERSPFTMDITPRPDPAEVVLSWEAASERTQGEGSLQFNGENNIDSMSFRNEIDRINYTNGICRCMTDLVQAYLDTKHDTSNSRALTLIEIN